LREVLEARPINSKGSDWNITKCTPNNSSLLLIQRYSVWLWMAIWQT